MKQKYRVIGKEQSARLNDVFKAINDLWYITAPEPITGHNPCRGCAFASSKALCLETPKCEGIIFKELN